MISVEVSSEVAGAAARADEPTASVPSNEPAAPRPALRRKPRRLGRADAPREAEEGGREEEFMARVDAA